MEEVSGLVEHIVFLQKENGFTVARLKESQKKDSTVIVGTLPSLQPGETVLCQGEWKMHPHHGRQFEVHDYKVSVPSDLAGIQKYLESGLVHGIGPVFAQKIVDYFGMDTLKVLDETPHFLNQVPGIGKKKVAKIASAWAAQKSIRDVMIFLRTHGVSPAYAQKIYKRYKEESIEKVKENPYRLAKEVFGIGFKLADQIALKLGFALHSQERLFAGIEFVFWELAGQGHTCYQQEELLPLASDILQVDPTEVEAHITALLEERVLVKKEKCLWLGPMWGFERGIAKDLLRLKASDSSLRSINQEKAADWAEGTLQISFAKEQKQAVIAALSDKVHVITGGPGTGKSTITNGILAVFSKLTENITLAAPTGRAAKRLSQITKKKASTIHSLLEIDFATNKFKKGKEDPLICDLLIVDEASMIDTSLLFYLLRAVPSYAKVLFIGDIDQLPSVGPGNVLKDIIASNQIGVTRLKEIFRQAKGSDIITNAHRINQGEFPSLKTPKNSDFHFIPEEDAEKIQQIILKLVKERIPKQWGFHPIEQIQVLAPMKRGIIGVEILNETLQMELNPSSQPLFRGGRRFHLKDKIMQIKNNYDKGVYNGDVGRIEWINMSDEFLTIRFDEEIVEYEFSELDQIVLAYATSVHKYQGSECSCIVIPLHPSHFKLLQRNLLYTAVTRGKQQVYLVGSSKAVGMSISNAEVKKRHTGLASALQEETLDPSDPLQLDLF